MFATLLNRLAFVLDLEDKPAEALVLEQRALVVRERVFGPASWPVAESLATLSSLHGKLGQFKEAEAAHKRASQIYQKIQGAAQPDRGWFLDLG
jgi:hypothetical protein